jgi:hypothetical protein
MGAITGAWAIRQKGILAADLAECVQRQTLGTFPKSL